jgi:hypothetical protein
LQAGKNSFFGFVVQQSGVSLGHEPIAIAGDDSTIVEHIFNADAVSGNSARRKNLNVEPGVSKWLFGSNEITARKDFPCDNRLGVLIESDHLKHHGRSGLGAKCDGVLHGQGAAVIVGRPGTGQQGVEACLAILSIPARITGAASVEAGVQDTGAISAIEAVARVFHIASSTDPTVFADTVAIDAFAVFTIEGTAVAKTTGKMDGQIKEDGDREESVVFHLCSQMGPE